MKILRAPQFQYPGLQDAYVLFVQVLVRCYLDLDRGETTMIVL